MRYASVPLAELQHVLGLTDVHVSGHPDWPVQVVPEFKVKDRAGKEVPHVVFADTETGLVVLKEPGLPAGRYPLRCANAAPPLVVGG